MRCRHPNNSFPMKLRSLHVQVMHVAVVCPRPRIAAQNQRPGQIRLVWLHSSLTTKPIWHRNLLYGSAHNASNGQRFLLMAISVKQTTRVCVCYIILDILYWIYTIRYAVNNSPHVSYDDDDDKKYERTDRSASPLRLSYNDVITCTTHVLHCKSKPQHKGNMNGEPIGWRCGWRMGPDGPVDNTLIALCVVVRMLAGFVSDHCISTKCKQHYSHFALPINVSPIRARPARTTTSSRQTESGSALLTRSFNRQKFHVLGCKCAIPTMDKNTHRRAYTVQCNGKTYAQTSGRTMATQSFTPIQLCAQNSSVERIPTAPPAATGIEMGTNIRHQHNVLHPQTQHFYHPKTFEYLFAKTLKHKHAHTRTHRLSLLLMALCEFDIFCSSRSLISGSSPTEGSITSSINHGLGSVFDCISLYIQK